MMFKTWRKLLQEPSPCEKCQLYVCAFTCHALLIQPPVSDVANLAEYRQTSLTCLITMSLFAQETDDQEIMTGIQDVGIRPSNNDANSRGDSCGC